MGLESQAYQSFSLHGGRPIKSRTKKQQQKKNWQEEPIFQENVKIDHVTNSIS